MVGETFFLTGVGVGGGGGLTLWLAQVLIYALGPSISCLFWLNLCSPHTLSVFISICHDALRIIRQFLKFNLLIYMQECSR